jgi:ElaB/YqjD/DUF883 family membrane-anchored ribosome-binding protein
MDERTTYLDEPVENLEERSPEEIRAEIERTRSEMSETINSIQEKLSPENLKDQAQEMIHDATIGRVEQMTDQATRKVRGFGETVMETIRQNPVPAVMVGIGLSWLVTSSMTNGSSQTRNYNYQPSYGSNYGSNRMSGGQTQGKVKEIASDVQEKAGQLVDDARNQVENLTEEARERADEMAWRLQEQKRMATDRFTQLLNERPLAVAAAAFAIGATIGLSIPETPQENQWMGEMRDNLVDKAQEATQTTIQKVRRVAEEAGRTVREEAEEQELVVS